jgi:hypothetical protein
LAFKITPKNLGGAIGAVDGLYYMSSPNVVFVCKAGRMFYTVNKPLVPEWPCIIEVSYIYSSYTTRYLKIFTLSVFFGVLKNIEIYGFLAQAQPA